MQSRMTEIHSRQNSSNKTAPIEERVKRWRKTTFDDTSCTCTTERLYGALIHRQIRIPTFDLSWGGNAHVHNNYDQSIKSYNNN
jgi:hypothetical protein